MNMSRSETSRIRVKCIVLGAAGAGKTSILRRYFSNAFFRERVPTLGSDFYTGRVKIKNPIRQDGEEKKELDHNVAHCVSLQIWDTAGRERFVAGRTAKFTAALSDAFFDHADAAMLVYDATSSTSFTQLLKWHADLMERMNRIEKKFPVLIVANKIDLFKSKSTKPRKQCATAPQRDVLGLGGHFRGKDCPYEYRASAPATYDKLKSKKSHGVVFSTYMDTGELWT
jgi:small GTP-binding protein